MTKIFYFSNTAFDSQVLAPNPPGIRHFIWNESNRKYTSGLPRDSSLIPVIQESSDKGLKEIPEISWSHRLFRFETRWHYEKLTIWNSTDAFNILEILHIDVDLLTPVHCHFPELRELI
jgi:hypothetical protein